MVVASNSVLVENIGNNDNSSKNDCTSNIKEFLASSEFSTILFGNKINTPNTAKISKEDHGKVEMNVWILQLVEYVAKVRKK